MTNPNTEFETDGQETVVAELPAVGYAIKAVKGVVFAGILKDKRGNVIPAADGSDQYVYVMPQPIRQNVDVYGGYNDIDRMNRKHGRQLIDSGLGLAQPASSKLDPDDKTGANVLGMLSENKKALGITSKIIAGKDSGPGRVFIADTEAGMQGTQYMREGGDVLPVFVTKKLMEPA